MQLQYTERAAENHVWSTSYGLCDLVQLVIQLHHSLHQQVESGGTVLSTNWKEVGSKTVERKPPDGMEWKKYEH